MELIDEVKVLCAKNKTNLTRITELYNQTYGTKLSHQSMHRKLQNKTIKYTEMIDLLAVLKCKVKWEEE